MASRLWGKSRGLSAWRAAARASYPPSLLTGSPIAPACQSQPPRKFSTLIKDSASKDYYAILSVSPHATHSQIKDAYYKLSMRYHPDHNKGSEEAHRKFTEITEAYSVLGKYDLRRRYDKGVFHKQEGPDAGAEQHQRSTRPHHHKGTSRPKFNFDEFYRMHYAEALRRHQRQTHEKKAAKDRAEATTVPVHVQRFLIVCVATSVFLGGWYLAILRKHNTGAASLQR